MSERKRLFNTLTTFAGIIYSVQGICSHNLYLAILGWAGTVFLLIALYRELVEIYGKWSITIPVILFFLILAFRIWDPISSIEQTETQKENSTLRDSLTTLRDSIKTLNFQRALTDTSKTYSRLINRPSLYMYSLVFVRNPATKYLIEIQIENNGNEEITDIKANIDTYVDSTSSIRTFTLYNKREISSENIEIGEKKILTLAHNTLLPKEFFEGIDRMVLYLYVYGTITYKGAIRPIKFCCLWNSELQMFVDVPSYKFTYK